MRFSRCWTSVLGHLKSTCRDLEDNDELRSRLSVYFTNCHLSQSGLSEYPCNSEMTVLECTKPLTISTIAFNAYTHFKGLVDQYCYFLQYDLLNHRLESNVNSLVAHSSSVSLLLSNLTGDSHKLHETSMKSLEGQSELLIEQKRLKEDLSTLSKSASKNFRNVESHFENLLKTSAFVKDELLQLHNKHGELLELQEQSRQASILMTNSIEKAASVTKTLTDGLNFVVKSQSDIQKQQKLLEDQQMKLNDLTKEKFHLIEKAGEQSLRVLRDTFHSSNELLEQQKQARTRLAELQEQQQLSFEKSGMAIASVVGALNDHHQKMMEYSNNLLDSFGHLSDLFQGFIGQLVTIENFFYYAISIFLAFLLTSTRRTQSARIYLLLSLIINFLYERWIVSDYIYHQKFWLVKSCFILLNLIILTYNAFTYTDLNEINNKMLGRILEVLQDNIAKSKQVATESTIFNSMPNVPLKRRSSRLRGIR